MRTQNLKLVSPDRYKAIGWVVEWCVGKRWDVLYGTFHLKRNDSIREYDSTWAHHASLSGYYREHAKRGVARCVRVYVEVR